MCHKLTSLVLALFMSMSLSVTAQKGCKVIHFREWWSYRIPSIGMSMQYVVPKQFGFQRGICYHYLPAVCNNRWQVGSKQKHIIWRKENLHTDYVEQNTYNLCNNEIIPTVFRFFFLLFQKIRKATEEKNRENRGKKHFFHRVCAYTGQSL